MTETQKKAAELLKKKKASEKKEGGLLDQFKKLFARFKELFAVATLSDGTEIMYDGELAVGTKVTITATDPESGETMELPLPEGKHELGGDMEGKSIVVDIDGVILEVMEGEEKEEEKEEAKSDEKQESEEKKEGKTEDKHAKEIEALKAENEKLKADQKEIMESLKKMGEVIDKSDKQKFKRTIQKVDHTSKLA